MGQIRYRSPTTSSTTGFRTSSPDGTTLVMLSFDGQVAKDDHPFYKQVYVRQLVIGESKPRVLGYVYGGQGTINVPSWSPDGKSNRLCQQQLTWTLVLAS